jgi:hypothetical protein
MALGKAIALNSQNAGQAAIDQVASVFEQAESGPGKPPVVGNPTALYKCSQPSFLFFGDDSGPNGSLTTTLAVAKSLETPFEILSLTAPRATVAVATGPGRFLEGHRSGAVAVMITAVCP